MNFRLIILALTSAFALSSCTPIIMGLYGMKNPKELNQKEILHYSKKYNIPLADSYELDTNYNSFLLSFDTTHYKLQKKNHSQPLQALYYDSTGQLQSYQINCYTGGFPNLKWDRDERFTTFPPKEAAPVDSMVPLEKQIKYLRLLQPTKAFSKDNFDYIVVVHWNRFMGRQSKRLISFVQKNCNLAGAKKVKVVYVNSDNFFTLKDSDIDF